MALVAKLHELSASFHDNASAGALHVKVLKDASTIQGFQAQVVTATMEALCMAAVAMLAPVLCGRGVVVLLYLAAAPLLVAVKRLFDKGFRHNVRVYRETLERMSSRLGEMLDMIPLAHAHGVQRAEMAMLDERIQDAEQCGHQMDLSLSHYNGLLMVTMQIAFTASLGLAGWFASRRTISPGEITMYCTYFMLLTGAVSALMAQYPALTGAREAVRSIREVLDCRDVEPNEGRIAVQSVEGAVRFEGVEFSYPGLSAPAVSDLNLAVRPGETIAVVGRSGAGKSTLMSLVIGFRRPTSGRILLNGVDMATLDLRTFRRFLSLVPQNVALHCGSIRENILFGMAEVRDETLDAAIRMANVAEFVERLPRGLDTLVGESGAKLSAGQRQRIAIARAMVRNPKVLILDEAASSLDPISEGLVREAVTKASRGRTTFIVAHSVSSVRHADRIVVMKHGKIVEAGSYDELSCHESEFVRIFAPQRRCLDIGCELTPSEMSVRS